MLNIQSNKVLEALGKAQERNPEQRMAQLIYNIWLYIENQGYDAFFVDDEEFVGFIEDYG